MGDEAATYSKLVKGDRSLEMKPVFGSEGDPVPISSFDSIEASIPPVWIQRLETLLESLPNRNWGYRHYPIVVTSSNFGIGHMLAYHQTKVEAHLEIAQAHTSVDAICNHFGWGKEVTILSHACVSADIGIKYASRLLQAGVAKEVLCFSFDFLSPFVSGGFYSLKILNSGFPAPYADQEFGSIGLGDGAAFAILSHQESSFAIQHQQTYNEMYHMTANAPDGSGFRHALYRIKAAIGDRKVWIKGHGTGTRDAGKLEADSVMEVFGNAPLVGWKGGIGHTLGSCGLVELSITMQAIRKGVAPGAVGTTGATLTPHVKTEAFDISGYDGVILSSNAFGGAHASYLLTHETR